MSTAFQTAPAAAKGTCTEGLERLPVAALRVPGASRVDAYCQTSGNAEPKLLWSREFQIRQEHLDEIGQRGFHVLWISRADAECVAGEIAAQKSLVLSDPSFTAYDRFVLLQFVASTELDAAYGMVRPTRYVEHCRSAGPELVDALFSGPATPRELFQRALRGATTATRFPMLAGYSALLARGLGVADRRELGEIATGGLVHDIGARRLKAEAVAVGSRGTGEERAAFEHHPQTSYEDLLDFPGVSRGQLMMAYQHHERIDGAGFPVGVPGEEIHPWARMLAIVDRFDALTVGRLGRRGLSIADALVRLQDDAEGGWLDPEMTRCWISLLNTK